MSRKGKDPIPLPKGTEIKISGNAIHVQGSRGKLEQLLLPGIEINQEEGFLHVALADSHSDQRNMHGLYRALINNMVVGVNNGFEIKLEMIGVGYRAAVQGQLLDLQVGFSHPTKLTIPDGIVVKVEKNTQISVQGIDKQRVGQFAATVRSMRPPEPYQGKGIRYAGEHVRKKAGKASAKK